MAKKTDRLTLRLSPELRIKLKQAAERRDRSENWLAVRLIEKGLGVKTPRKPPAK